MANALQGWRGSEVLRAGFLLTALNVATGALGYVFQIAMGRALDAGDYAAFNTVLAIAMVACSPMAALETVAARHVANVAATAGLGAVRSLYHTWTAWISGGCAVVAAAMMIAAPQVQSSLRVPDMESFWLLTGIILATVLAILTGAVLRGLQSFACLGSLGFGGVLAKIFLCLFFVGILLQGLRGALAGVLLATMIVLVASIWAISRRWGDALPSDTDAADFPVRMIVPVVMATIGLTTMTQIDLVLVNRFFDPASAGQYTPASILGKAVLYLPGGMVTAILPIVAARHARSEHSTGHAFQAIVATILVCGALAFAYFAAGPWFVWLLYGEKYVPAGNLLSVYGPAMFPMAVAMVIQGFLLAQGRTVFCWVAATLAAVELVVLQAWHPSLHAVIGTIAVFNTTLAIVGGILMIPEFQPATGSVEKS